MGTSLSYTPLVLSKNDKNDNCEAFSCCKLEFTRSGSEERSRRQRAGGERRRGQCLRAVQSGNSSDLLESGPSAQLLLTKHTKALVRLHL